MMNHLQLVLIIMVTEMYGDIYWKFTDFEFATGPWSDVEGESPITGT